MQDHRGRHHLESNGGSTRRRWKWHRRGVIPRRKRILRSFRIWKAWASRNWEMPSWIFRPSHPYCKSNWHSSSGWSGNSSSSPRATELKTASANTSSTWYSSLQISKSLTTAIWISPRETSSGGSARRRIGRTNLMKWSSLISITKRSKKTQSESPNKCWRIVSRWDRIRSRIRKTTLKLYTNMARSKSTTSCLWDKSSKSARICTISRSWTGSRRRPTQSTKSSTNSNSESQTIEKWWINNFHHFENSFHIWKFTKL